MKNMLWNLVPFCMGEKYFQEVGLIFYGWKIFSGCPSQNFDMPSASGYMVENDFQEFGPKFMTCPQLVGTWMKNIFRNLVPIF